MFLFVKENMNIAELKDLISVKSCIIVCIIEAVMDIIVHFTCDV